MFSEKKHLGQRKWKGFIEKQRPATQHDRQLVHKYDFIIIYIQGETTNTPVHKFLLYLILLKIPPQHPILLYHNEYDKSIYP